MSELVEEGYVRASEIVAKAKSNFTSVFKVLSLEKQKGMNAFYAFCRHSDDLSDSVETIDIKREQLEAWTGSIRESLSGRGTSDPMVAALTDTVEKFSIPHQYVFDVLRGVTRDLEPVSLETMTDLRAYCYLVASSVGLACLHIWGFDSTDERYLRPALDCGIAMQITNILRDVNEDFSRNRVYIPKEDWLDRGLDLDCQIEPFDDHNWKDLIQFECRRAQNLFHSALDLQEFLDRPGRKIFRGMIGRYWAILKKVRRDPVRILRERISLTPFEKLKLNAQAVLGFPALKIPPVKNTQANTSER